MSNSLLERRHRVLGRGAPLFYDEPLHVVRGEGVWLHDAHGRRYLDAYNNVPIVGHCHPRVVEAIARQANELNVHTRYLHENIVRYAERLTATFDGLDMAIFTCTGSEANDLALRMARLLTGSEGIICSNNTYHGNTAAVDELSTTFRGGQPGSSRVRSVPFPETYRPVRGLQGAELADAYVSEVRSCIEHFQRSGIGLAGMLVCPIFANECLPDVPSGFLERAAQLVREAGGFIIFDEVQAGFGRTGEFWGHDKTGVVPDIVTLGKPMGNGYPIGGVVSRSSIVNAFRDRVMYFNTFAGNPVACAAALAVLDVIESDGLLEHVRQIGPQVTDRLRKLMPVHEGIGDVRGKGMFWAVELVTDRAARTPDAARAKAVVNRMRDHGVLISRLGAHDNVLKIRPPLPFAEPHAALLLEALDQSLAETRSA
ncbi:aspartate aminotransferase family protein [Ideonella sp.]|uniref:aspartate aminotransferase family protein n=1 Tax=Ideonella sp. TaxID=1929293 RepID=UPI002B468330|nr:aspartate aminotransferase family protein [Ideonella sp.]HJV71702.1 aspartate aminotransferase family protein [Ideonella sp.]